MVSNPSGICVDNLDNLYLADSGIDFHLILGNGRVIRIDTKNGNAITQIGRTLTPAPNGLAVDYDGNFYYTTPTDNVIYKMDAAASFASAPFVGSGRGSADGVGQRASFNGPSNLMFDSSNYLYVADAENNLIRKVDVFCWFLKLIINEDTQVVDR